MAWLAQRCRWLSYSVGTTITEAIHQVILAVPASAWTPAIEPDGEVQAAPGAPRSGATA